MQAAGLEWVETRDFLPQQHFMVFAKPDVAAPRATIEPAD